MPKPNRISRSPRSPLKAPPGKTWADKPRDTPPGSAESFASDDEFLSPVVLSTSPSFERDRRTVLRILASGQVMCRNRIKAEYIESVLDEEGVAIWLVRDANNRVFGFALTIDTEEHVSLEIICTHPRKGEGTSLFRNVLVYSQETNRPLVLQAINAKVAILYARAAEASGRRAGLVMDSNLYGEWETVTADELVERLQTRRGTIDMIFPL